MRHATCRSRLGLGALLALGLMALSPPISHAQELRATIVGTVFDESKAVLPGATVKVVNVETGVEQTSQTDAEGRYRVTNLLAGAYEVHAELMGFRTMVRRGLVMEMGRTAAVDLTLSVGDRAEVVVVVGEAPLLDTSAAGLGHMVTRQNIENLPLNGRSFQQLGTLQPGVTVPAKMGNGGGAGAGTKIIASGMRANYTNYTMDGVDYNEVRNQSPASALGVMMGVEAVREFKVATNSYSAEFGRNAGALVSITTRAGTNSFHGSVYEFHRDAAMDARNFFDTNKADFSRNQFGFLLDGPIVRNRTFFLVNYEGLRQSLGRSQVGLVPDESAREGIIPGRPAFAVDPAIRPILSLYPLPNGRNFGNGIGEYLTSAVDESRQNFVTARVDHTFSAGNSVYARYMIDKASVDSHNQLEHASRDSTRAENLVVEASRVFGPRWVSTVRFGYNAPSANSVTSPFENVPEAISDRGTSRFNVAGLTRTAGSTDGGRTQHAFQLNVDVQHLAGAHSLKFGAVAQRFNTTINSSPAEYPGDWTAGSLESFLKNEFETVDVTGAQFKTRYQMQQDLIGAYVQDTWNVVSRLTLNLGLRYEIITSPTEKDGQLANFREPRSGLTPLDQAPTVGNPLFENPSLGNWAPRLGFAWRPFRSEKTVVRGGFGVYHQQVLSGTWLVDAMPPFSNSVRIQPGGRFPNIPADRIVDPPSTSIEPQFTDYFLKQPTALHWNFGIAEEWIRGTVLTLGYAGSRGYNLTTRTNTNIFPYVRQDDGRLFFPRGTQRINPNWGNFGHTVSDRESFYHSLQAGIQRRFADGIAFQSSYTFSKAIDEGSHETASATFTSFSRTSADPFDHTYNRGLADFDVRHSLVTNVIYELPFGPGQRFGGNTSGVTAKLLEGWHVAGIVTAATGSPFEVVIGFDHAGRGDRTAERPDLVAGGRPTVNPGNPVEYFDVTQFQLPPSRTLGNLGRNVLIGPGLLTVDLTLAKHLGIAGTRRLELRFDAFNVTNRPNFQVPTATAGTAVGGVALFNSRGERLPQAARIVQTTTTARQMQVSARFVF